MGASEVSALLWRERQLLDLLLFKLEEEQLILAAARPHLLAPASAEVAQVMEQIAVCETEREAASWQLAQSLGLEPPVRLAELVEASATPWDEIFADHRRALTESVERIRGLAAGTKALLAARLTAVTDALNLLGHAPVDAYTSAGSGGHLVRGSL
ncbi:MAG TPA: flagellar export chaperone FlgN [Acidimicrobiales bacterium]|nr:flagellar export chaperone FlgN [Acidimicrobiales bacterium]